MSDYKLEFSSTTIPYTENSRLLQFTYYKTSFTVSNNRLYEIEFSKDNTPPTISTSKDDVYPLGNAKLLHVEPLTDEQTAIIVKVPEALRIYLHTKGGTLQLASEDDQFHDVYEWNKPGNDFHFGHFYHNSTILGMMTSHVEYGTTFYAISKDALLSGDFPIMQLNTNVDIFQTYNRNSISRMLADLNDKPKSTIVSRNYDGLAFFEMNEEYGIDFVMNGPKVSDNGGIFFAGLTNGRYNDIVHFNSSGMFLYEYVDGYKFCHYNPLFSKEKGWTTDHTRSVQFEDINSDGYQDMVFTGPRGIAAITYYKYANLWTTIIDSSDIAPSRRHAQVIQIVPKITNFIGDTYLITHLDGSINWAKLVEIPSSPPQLVPSIPWKPVAKTSMTPRRTDTPKMFVPTVLLRDMNIWSDLVNCVSHDTGKPKFSLPLVNLPDPGVRLWLQYDATNTVNDILGVGWLMPLNLIATDRGGSVFDEDTVFIIHFQDSTQALVFLPKESNSDVRSYTMPSMNNDLTFRARFYINLDQWVIDLGTGVKQFYGGHGAVSKDIVWKNWHGTGFDNDNQLESTRLWYLSEIQDEHSNTLLEFSYDIDTMTVNSGLKYTKSVYLKKSRDNLGNEIYFHYQEKDASELKTYDAKDGEGNYIWEPIRTRYLTGYEFRTPTRGRQNVNFKYRTSKGIRFLEEIHQSEDVIHSYVAKFEYLTQPMGKFTLKNIHLPYEVRVEFTYASVAASNQSNELKRLDVPSNYKVTIGNNYILVSFLNSKTAGQVVMRMFNQDMTKELYTSDSRVKSKFTKRWPLLGAHGSVVAYDVIRGDNFFGVILFYSASKLLCLFGQSPTTEEWIMDDSKCHVYGDDAAIHPGTDFCLVVDDAQSKVELIAWNSTKGSWNKQIIIPNAAGRTAIAVYRNRFVTYNDNVLSIGYKSTNGTWNLKTLTNVSNCLGSTEATLKRFDLKQKLHRIYSGVLRSNLLKFSHNLVALNCLQENGYQLQSVFKFFTIDRQNSMANYQEFIINQDNLKTLVSSEEQDVNGNYLTYKYEIQSNGEVYIKVNDIRGPILKELPSNRSAAKQMKRKIMAEYEKLLNKPTARLLVDLRNYIMTFSDKTIKCRDHKFTFGGNQWQHTITKRNLDKASIRLGDRFLLEKENKEANVKLLRYQTKETLSNLPVNFTDIRLFYPVYIATNVRGEPVRVVEFDENAVRQKVLYTWETLSPYSNSNILITHQGTDTKSLIFRQQYGITKFLPSSAVHEVAVFFDGKKRITGYEYDADTASLTGNTVIYSKMSLIPANDKSMYGWLEQSVKNGSSIAYDNQGEIVRQIPFNLEQGRSNAEVETEEEHEFRKATTIFDKSGKLVIAQCAPFRPADETVAYYGFEDYETNAIGSGTKQWYFQAANVIRNGFALTGTNYLHQDVEPIEGIFQPVNQNAEYIASTWVRIQNITEIPEIGQVVPYLKAIVFTAPSTDKVFLLGEVKYRLDDWIYLEVIIDLHKARKTPDKGVQGELQISIWVGPTLTTQIDIDFVRFSPLISDFSVSIFDKSTFFNTAVIQSTGMILRKVYDAYDATVGIINEYNQVEELKVYTKAGVMAKPRCTVTIKPEMGFYEQFAPFAFANRWKVHKNDSWTIAPYQLEHHGVERNTLELSTQDVATESYGFRVQYSLAGNRAAFVVNDFVELSKRFSDCSLNGIQSIPIEGELLLVKESERLLVWIDGGLYIDQSSDAFNKSLRFTMTGIVSIKDMMVFSRAYIKVIYQNSVDEPTQEITLESAESVVVRERLYDELGRQRITTQQVRIVRSPDEALLKYIPNFVSNDDPTDHSHSIWKTGRLDGLATQILGHPFGFTETRYAKNPLNEKITVGLPGSEFSTFGNFARRFSSKTSNLFVANRYPLSMNVTYRVEIQLGGMEDITVLNDRNQKIAHYVHVPGSKDHFSTYKLNTDGNPLQVLPPLYFERTGSFHKTNSDLMKVNEADYLLQRKLGTHIDYDGNGKPIRKTTADAGPLENVYDKDKRLRFVLYYSYDEPHLLETIIYFTYDQLGRLLTTGQLLDTKLPKDKLLNVNLSTNNSLEYQSFNYANFERSPTLRGKLLRTITRNRAEPFVEVLHVNDRGNAVDKRIILPNLTSKPDEILIGKNYLAGRLKEISYPAKFLDQPFIVAYGYDKLGRMNSIGIPGDPNRFLIFTYNAAGQVLEETYEPASVYAFKQMRKYNEPGFLIKLESPFQTEQISYTEFSYGGVNRGDGSVTRIKCSANWHKVGSSSGIGVRQDAFVNDFMSLKDSKVCFDALKNAGYLNDKNRQVKAFYPDLEIEFPIICTTGITGRHVSNVLGRYGFPVQHGYRFDYGAHQELTKAKYFIGTDEPDPLQPETFAKEIPKISTATSQRIWKALKEAQFLIEDPDRTNLSTSHGKQSRKSFIGSKLFDDLKDVKPDYASYAEQLRKLLTSRYIKHQGNFTLPQMKDLMHQWLGKPSSVNFVQRAADDIFEMLGKKRYFSHPLDAEFEKVLTEFKEYHPEIVRILFTYFGRQLGRSEFDVESYQIDANGNHGTFNTGYNHYTLKYEKNSNRVQGVQYQAFDSPRPEEIFRMQHDSRGNVIQALHKGISSMEYHSVSNLLQRATMTNGSVVEFYYDSKGERVLKRLTDSFGKIRKEMHYLRDDQGRSLVERELSYLTDNQPPAVLVTMYVYGPNGLIGFLRRDQFYGVITDHQGSVRLIVRNGEVVAAYDYLPYGNFMRTFGADAEAHIPYRYTGQEWDPEIELYNYHARLYDPTIGRFYQIDPREQYFSPYKYAGNSPVSMVDPSGEIAFVAVFFALVGLYLGGARANDNLCFWEWDYASLDTYTGMGFGALAGYFLPGGFWLSVDALVVTFGVTEGLAIALNSFAGIMVAYFSAEAANNSWDPRDWDFSARTISALFDGFAMGSSMFGSLYNANEYYKQLESSGKKLFIAGTIFSGSGLIIMGGVATNWDVKKPQFWFAVFSAITAAPDLAILGGKFIKATRFAWQDLKMNVRLSFHNYDDYVKTFFILRGKDHGRSITEAITEIFRLNPELKMTAKIVGNAAAIGVASYLIGSALNNGLTWNMTDVGTYQNLITAIQISGQAIAVGKHNFLDNLKKERLAKARIALELTEAVAFQADIKYREIMVEEKEKNNIKRQRLSPQARLKLKDNLIPNPVMSLMVAGDIVIVGFSSDRATSLFLVYEHKNLFKPEYVTHVFSDDNSQVGGKELEVRDDKHLNKIIDKVIKRAYKAVIDQNKISYMEKSTSIYDDLLNIEKGTLPDDTREAMANAIHHEILNNGIVGKEFLATTLDNLEFHNESIEYQENEIKDKRKLYDDINKLIMEGKIEKKDMKDATTDRFRKRNDLKRAETDLDVIIASHKEAYIDKLYEKIKEFDNLPPWKVTNCAEPHTLCALERQKDVFDKVYFTKKSYDIALDIDFMSSYTTDELPLKAKPIQRCVNCVATTSLIENVLTDDGFMEELERSSARTTDHAKESFKRMHFLGPIINLQKTIKEAHNGKHERQKRSSDSYKRENLLELGDEYLSKIDINGTLLLVDVVLAKCQHRRLKRLSNKTSSQMVNSTELLCGIVELFENSVEQAAMASGISLDDLNVDAYTMQQEVMPLLRLNQFETIPEIMLNYALTSLTNEVSLKASDNFRIAFESLQLNDTIAELFVRMHQTVDADIGMDIAYNVSSRHWNTTHMTAGLSTYRKYLN